MKANLLSQLSLTSQLGLLSQLRLRTNPTIRLTMYERMLRSPLKQGLPVRLPQG